MPPIAGKVNQDLKEHEDEMSLIEDAMNHNMQRQQLRQGLPSLNIDPEQVTRRPAHSALSAAV